MREFNFNLLAHGSLTGEKQGLREDPHPPLICLAVGIITNCDV